MFLALIIHRMAASECENQVGFWGASAMLNVFICASRFDAQGIVLKELLRISLLNTLLCLVGTHGVRSSVGPRTLQGPGANHALRDIA